MLRLNKRTEYALLALRYLGQRSPETRVSVKEIANWYSIPEMLLAKVLQVLKRGKILSSTKGSGGGYGLARPLSDTPLYDVLALFNEQVRLVDCLGDEDGQCQQKHHCDIRGPLDVLDRALREPLKQLTIAELFVDEPDRALPKNLSIYR